ncbi:MAG: hypothetical protein DRI44_00795 [Chlamydiae bacterium]|nr:MAG: hypothetical protein DRI44_00795 [Chlamydiota bacterium]
MKKLPIAILLIATFVLTVSSSVNADTYQWTPLSGNNNFSGGWDLCSNWYNATIQGMCTNGIGYPSAPGDVALINGGGTNSFFQIWPNSYTDLFANIATFSVAISNELVLGSGGFNMLVFNNSGEKSILSLTNMMPDTHEYVNNTEFTFYFDTMVVLSNDLEIISESTPYLYKGAIYKDASNLCFDKDTSIVGDYSIIKKGRGDFMLGQYYGYVTAPQVHTTKPIYINGCYFIVSDQAAVDPPVYMTSEMDCENNYYRSRFINLGNTYDVDFVFSNAYFDFVDWLGTAGTNAGDMTFLDWGLVNSPDDYPLYLAGNINGDGEIWKGFSDSPSGNQYYLGAISPGVNNIGSLGFRNLTNYNVNTVILGAARNTVDVNIEINGMRNYIGEDVDSLYFIDFSSIPLDNINLNIINDGTSNPYRTNEIMYSNLNAFNGSFKNVNWSNTNRIGTIIPTPESILVTGIPPLSNFFDVYADRVILVKGETQQVLIARSPFEMDVNATADESWISLPAVTSLSNDAPVTVPVTVPADQPTTNGYGLSSGTITFSAAADPSVKIEEDVFVLEPGYFELNKSKLWIMAYKDDSASVRAYSPLTVGVDAAIENGGSWISFDGPSSVHLTNDGKYVYLNISTNQPVGTTGLVSFTNIDTPTVKHDVPVEVVGPGFFEVTPQAIELTAGETQGFINISAPFMTDVNISSPDSWIAVPASVSLDGNGYSIPVVIPVDQAAGSTGTVSFVSTCSTNYSYDVTIIVKAVCGDFTVNTNLLEFVTGIDTQKFVQLISGEGCTTVNIQPIASSWITVINSISLLSSTTDVAITIPIDQADGSTGMVRFTSVEKPAVSYDVDIIVVPEPIIIISLLLAFGALLLRRAN